jgi:hypothetical protein
MVSPSRSKSCSVSFVLERCIACLVSCQLYARATTAMRDTCMNGWMIGSPKLMTNEPEVPTCQLNCAMATVLVNDRSHRPHFRW